MTSPMSEPNVDTLINNILEDTNFIEAVFQGTRRNEVSPWQRVTIRPISLKGVRHLQFVYFDGKQDIAKNYRPDTAVEPLNELLLMPFKTIRAATTGETVRVQFSKKGRPIIHKELQPARSIALSVSHDRIKPSLLDIDEAAPFLIAIGVATAEGKIRADQQRKFRQINEFLRLIEETGELESLKLPIRVVDLGCGSAALTFATYYYLNFTKQLPTTMIGVDTKEHLMARHRETAASLNWDDLEFQTGRITDFDPLDKPDIVLALHACDTATDEALAQAIRWQSRLIFSAPCCHHNLQARLAKSESPESFRPIMRHGILRERLGDILTDAFRAHILRLLGYSTDVIEFIDQQHTPKNVMIRAIFKNGPPPPALVDQYNALKANWDVIPYLEELVQDQLDAILAASR